MLAPTENQPTERRARPVPGPHTESLLGGLDAVLKSLRDETGRPALADTLERLLALARTQFEAEEHRFDADGTAGHEAHRQAHRSLLAYMSFLLEGIAGWGHAQALIRLRFLDHSLTSHLLEERLRHVLWQETP